MIKNKVSFIYNTISLLKMIKEIKVKTNKRQQIIDITDQIRKTVKESRVEEGIVSIYVQHTTAALIIN